MSKSSFSGNPLLDFQGPFRTAMDIILASASPRRQALLTSLGISFQVIPSSFREPEPEPGCQPWEYALFLAQQKARHLPRRKPDSLIIAADTIVVLDNAIMNKPESEDHALDMLSRLQGNTHQVITAVSISSVTENNDNTFFCKTDVEMIEAGPDVLREYIRTGEPEGKAGAYAIQGLGAFLVKSIKGSYTNVVGLPLAEVCTALLKLNALKLPGKQQ